MNRGTHLGVLMSSRSLSGLSATTIIPLNMALRRPRPSPSPSSSKRFSPPYAYFHGPNTAANSTPRPLPAWGAIYTRLGLSAEEAATKVARWDSLARAVGWLVAPNQADHGADRGRVFGGRRLGQVEEREGGGD